MKTLRRRLLWVAFGLFAWECLQHRTAPWSHVAAFELGLLVSVGFTFMRGRGVQWRG